MCRESRVLTLDPILAFSVPVIGEADRTHQRPVHLSSPPRMTPLVAQFIGEVT